MPAPHDPRHQPAVVLDTNAVLDWLVFRDPCMQAWAARITAGHVHWLGCAAMRLELTHMLSHASLARWAPDGAAVLAIHARHCHQLDTPDSAPAAWGAASRLRCTDPDDQVFIDLAIAHGARWLLTHDRALLKLARRALPMGLHIQRPAANAGA